MRRCRRRSLPRRCPRANTSSMRATYTEAALLVTSRACGIDVVDPMHADTSWQARTPGAFATAQFAVDWDAGRVTCPTGGRA